MLLGTPLPGVAFAVRCLRWLSHGVHAEIPGCRVTTPIERPLAITGAVVLPIAGGELGLLALGALMFWFGMRRRGEVAVA